MASLFSSYRLIKESGLFDEGYYRDTYPEIKEKNLDPLLHYLEVGAKELRNPNATFDAEDYVQRCRERGERVENPLLHYIESRAGETASPPPAREATRQVPAPAQPASDFLVNLDRVSIESDSGRTRLRGYGWCLAADVIVELEIRVGSACCRARYGLPRADVAREHPRALKADHSGFEFILEQPPLQHSGEVDVIFMAKTAARGSLEKLVRAELAESRAAESQRHRTAPREAKRTPFKQPPMQLQVDSAEVDASGILRIVGWAVCLAPIVSVEVFVDDAKIGSAETGKARDDVAERHPEYPHAGRSGFVLCADSGAFAAGERLIKVRATASTGISREAAVPLRLSPERRRSVVSSKDSKVDCFCDLIRITTAGMVTVKGWVVGGAATERVSLLLDDQVLGDAEIGIDRPDVGNLFPRFAHARKAGFAFRHQGPAIPPGEHLIVVRHHADGEDTEVLLPAPAIEAGADDAASEVHARQQQDVLLNVDQPKVVDGAAVVPVRGDLEVVGWALSRQGTTSVEIAVDGRLAKSVPPGIRRADVLRVFPECEQAESSGFAALLPHRSLAPGPHTVTVSARNQNGAISRVEFRVLVEEAPETDGPWALRRRMSPAETQLFSRPLAGKPQPLFVVAVMATAASAAPALRATISSLANQVYANWLLFLIAPAGAAALRRALPQVRERLDQRVTVISDPRPALRALGAQGGDAHLLVLHPGDELGCDALLEFAVEATLHPQADFFYCDERRINPRSGKTEAFFKPQWSPDLLLSMDYLGRAWCARSGLVRRAKIASPDIAGPGTYHLELRLTEQASTIRHVPATLLQLAGAGKAAGSLARTALRRALRRRGIPAEVTAGRTAGTFRVRRKTPVTGLVSIVIPTCAARGLVRICIESLRKLTAYRHYEIVAVENIPAERSEWKTWLREHADRVIQAPSVFNWSRYNNLAAAEARGEFLLFLNDDIEVIDPQWLDVLVEQAARPEVGAVGPQLLYPDRRVQHAGMFLTPQGVIRHAFRYAAEQDGGYFGLALSQREVIAVTGACLLTRRGSFEQLGGFDEAHDVVNNDVDFCLRLRQNGLHTLYTPHAQLIHHELASRVGIPDHFDVEAFSRKWRGLFASGDPYFHKRLAGDRDDYAIESEPVEIHCAGHPVLARESIRRILVLKLDHIGDCVTALPAVRRLRQHFPLAEISVLASAASKTIWELEPVVDRVIQFDFFHGRSALGRLERTDEHWVELRSRLLPYAFDLAIDLRKHWETRSVLQHTGARYLAGFDTKGKYPWLDIALEWAEDSAMIRKRQHASDDLINLVDAVAAASETDRRVIVGTPTPLSRETLSRLELPRWIFRKRLVCVHPGAGNDIKQWPIEYFALLIDKLVESEDVHVVLTGSRDEVALGQLIISATAHAKAVWSTIGRDKLSDLPGLLSRCALFIGNDSGPKHIAAGLGIPTVGIHSGILDAREWGPLGETAVAIQRAMSCSPCYRLRVEDCPRGLICLRGILPEEVFTISRRLLLAPSEAAQGVGTRRAPRFAT